MKKLFFVLFVVSLLLGIITTPPTYGRGSRRKATPPQQTQLPVIASVAANAITVTENKTTKTFTITQFTEINVNGQRATVADLKPGMTVNVTLGTDASKVSRINASGAPK